MTPTAREHPPVRPPRYGLLKLVLGLVAGFLGATCFIDVAGFLAPDSTLHILLRVLCGLAIGLATVAVMPFPNRRSPT